MPVSNPPPAVPTVQHPPESWKRLQAMTDADLQSVLDEHAPGALVELGFYLDEINRRAQRRAMDAAHDLARKTLLLSVVATVVAVVSLFVR